MENKQQTAFMAGAAIKTKMNLSKGCPYCSNLKCTKEPLLEFECAKNKELKIKNAGACFVAKLDNGKNIIIENCPDFADSNTRH